MRISLECINNIQFDPPQLFSHSSYFLAKFRDRFLRLIVEATVTGKDMRQYTKTLRQMAALLSAASVAEGLSESDMSVNGKLSEAEGVPKVTITPQVSPHGDQKLQTTQNGGKRGGRKRGKNNTQRHHQQFQQQSKVVEVQSANSELATLAKLQSYFRVRNGFRMLQSQMEVRIFLK